MQSPAPIHLRDGGYLDKRFASTCASAQSGPGTQAETIDVVLSQETSHRDAKPSTRLCSNDLVGRVRPRRSASRPRDCAGHGKRPDGGSTSWRQRERDEHRNRSRAEHGRRFAGSLRRDGFAPAAYNVEASLSGFQTVVRQGIRLVVGTQAVVDFTLGPSAVQETITVNAGAPVVDTVSVALGTVIEQKQMAELPLIDRSYSKLIVLAPAPTNTCVDRRRAIPAILRATAAIHRLRCASRGTGVPDGQHQRAELLEPRQRIGAAWNDAWCRGDCGIPGVDKHLQRAVRRQRRRHQRHHQVRHESVARLPFEYYRNDRFDASNYFDTLLGRPDPTLDKNQFGGSFGGPLLRNKAFFFVTYEGLRQTIGQTQAINVPDANARNGIINGVNVGVNPAIAPLLQLYPLPTRQTPAQAAQGIGRFDITNESSCRRELLRRPLRLHNQRDDQPVRAIHVGRGVGVRAKLGVGDSAVAQ